MSKFKAFRESLLFFVIISMLIHTLSVFILDFKFKKSLQDQIKVEVEVAEKRSAPKSQQANFQLHKKKYKKKDIVIPKVAGEKKAEAKTYWGTGLYGRVDCFDNAPSLSMNSLLVTAVIEGYPADRAGIRVEDCILEINGKKYGEDGIDLAGEEPLDMEVLVMRGSVTFTVKIKREPILYEQQ